MASRFWKVSGFALTAESDMDVRSLRVWAAGTQLTPVISCSHEPSSGALDNLLDGSPSTGCVWPAEVITQPGFYIGLDFVDDLIVDAIELDVLGNEVSDAMLCQKVNGLWAVAISDWFGEGEPMALGLESAYQKAVLADAPTTYLACNESQGDALDTAGGTAGFGVNSIALRRARKLTARGLAITMPDRNDNLPLLRAKNAQVGNLQGDFSLEFVMQGTLISGASKPCIFSKEVGGQHWPEYRLQLDGGNLNLLVRHANDNFARAIDQTLALNLLDGSRHHVVFTKLGNRYRLYVDSVAAIDSTATQAPFTNTGVLGICGDYLLSGYQSSPFRGAVMGVAIYDKALTGQQVAQHANSLGTMPQRGLKTRRMEGKVLPGIDSPRDLSMQIQQPGCARDMEFGGNGRIYGTVMRKNTPANVPLSRRVRLHRSRDGLLARETYSRADGYFSFDEINPRYEYDVIAWDHEKQEFSAVANNQLAEVMP